jgi:hypothetical protein
LQKVATFWLARRAILALGNCRVKRALPSAPVENLQDVRRKGLRLEFLRTFARRFRLTGEQLDPPQLTRRLARIEVGPAYPNPHPSGASLRRMSYHFAKSGFHRYAYALNPM